LLDDGAANTKAIIEAHPNDNPSNNAAWLCRSYKAGGYNDWYLPSINELNKMYLYARDNGLIGENCSGSKIGGMQCLVGSDWGKENSGKIYWSSSENSGYNYGAWFQYFSNGNKCSHLSKIANYFGVRAVRTFTPFNSTSNKSFSENLFRNLYNEKKIDVNITY